MPKSKRHVLFWFESKPVPVGVDEDAWRIASTERRRKLLRQAGWVDADWRKDDWAHYYQFAFPHQYILSMKPEGTSRKSWYYSPVAGMTPGELWEASKTIACYAGDVNRFQNTATANYLRRLETMGTLANYTKDEIERMAAQAKERTLPPTIKQSIGDLVREEAAKTSNAFHPRW